VGDDWQSIYRFAGSDISIMKNFESHFGYTQTIYLDKTFRFNNQIEKVASRFILQNPAQIPKEIITLKQEKNCRVFIHFPGLNNHDLITDALNRVFHEKKNATVLLLGRYNGLRNSIDFHRIKRDYPELSVSFKTVHSSKGTEADYAVILGIDKGKYGFPSEIVDDPILEAVLSESESFKHAEERRLFYVALTRARNGVHLLSATKSPSPFLRELMVPEYNVEVYGRPSSKPVLCPSCKSGEMILHNGPKGNFYGCSNFPLCNFTTEVCPVCKTGFLIHKKEKVWCNNIKCDYNAIQCPQCKTGRLIRRKGKHGYFIGCSNFGKQKCDYTIKL
jgi:DNA helicase-4